MPMIDGVPTRVYDPIQSVLALLPPGIYGTYEGLMDHMLVDGLVPMEIKEGLRYVSAVRIGCEFCKTFRQSDRAGERLLAEKFYRRAAEPEPMWTDVVPNAWVAVFEMACEVLSGSGVVDPASLDKARRDLDDAQIVEALFYMLVAGASHRLSVALDLPAACAAIESTTPALRAT